MLAGDYDTSGTFLDKAISINKYYSEAYWFRSQLNEKLGQTEAAQADRKIAEDFHYIPYL